MSAKYSLCVWAAALALPWTIQAQEGAKKLPEFSLKDPAGQTFTHKSVSKKGVVLVVTAPILKEASNQEEWSKYLEETKGDSKAKLVFLEDMEPSAFKGMARKEMKKEYTTGQETILLLDEDGEVRQKLGVREKKTMILVYNKKRKLIHIEAGRPSRDAAAAIWKALD